MVCRNDHIVVVFDSCENKKTKKGKPVGFAPLATATSSQASLGLNGLSQNKNADSSVKRQQSTKIRPFHLAHALAPVLF